MARKPAPKKKNKTLYVALISQCGDIEQVSYLVDGASIAEVKRWVDQEITSANIELESGASIFIAQIVAEGGQTSIEWKDA